MDLTDIFSYLEETIPATKISIKVDHKNLETVYIEKLAKDRFFISDFYETFKYLEQGNDPTFVKLKKANIEKIKSICVKNEVVLILPPDNETYHQIGVEVKNSELVAGINNMCNAIDEVFNHMHSSPNKLM